ncbi:FHA domain-containing protein [Halobacteriovorax sp. ZH4_bin.1]|uniref:FHA domain-containing protein n=1 Tax=unclassified Halobacteriovorax TaxID=2639665 RepID=UPI00371208E7
MSISLIIKSGENKAKVLIKPKLSFGRSKSSVDISIDDSKISSKHLEITYKDKEIVVKDLGSTNGTFINNKKVTSDQRLYIYETIRIGNCIICIDLNDLTDIEYKFLTRPIDPNEDAHENTQTSTALADQTGFLALNNLSLEKQKVKAEVNKKQPIQRTKKKVTKKKRVEPEDKTVMTKILKFFK